MAGSQKTRLYLVHLCVSWILFSLSFLKTHFEALGGFRSVVIGEGTACSTVSCQLWSHLSRPVVLTAFLWVSQRLWDPFSIKTAAWRRNNGYGLGGSTNFMIAWGNWWPAGERLNQPFVLLSVKWKDHWSPTNSLVEVGRVAELWHSTPMVIHPAATQVLLLTKMGKDMNKQIYFSSSKREGMHPLESSFSPSFLLHRKALLRGYSARRCRNEFWKMHLLHLGKPGSLVLSQSCSDFVPFSLSV